MTLVMTPENSNKGKTVRVSSLSTSLAVSLSSTLLLLHGTNIPLLENALLVSLSEGQYLLSFSSADVASRVSVVVVTPVMFILDFDRVSGTAGCVVSQDAVSNAVVCCCCCFLLFFCFVF